MKLLLTGFMGSGKSTLLEFWKNDFPGQSFDLDQRIANHQGIPPQELGKWIEEKGWEEFRSLEKSLLKDLLQGDESRLISLGGGAFTPENIRLIKEANGLSVWLKACPTVLWERVSQDDNRPLVKEGKESFVALHSERMTYYQQADFVLESEKAFPSFRNWCLSDSRLRRLIDE